MIVLYVCVVQTASSFENGLVALYGNWATNDPMDTWVEANEGVRGQGSQVPRL